MALDAKRHTEREELLQSRVLHADESPITILGQGGKKQRGYIWAYASAAHTPCKAVVYQVHASRSGQHARAFLRHHHAPPEPGQPPEITPWSGHLMVDDYAGYKALINANAADTAPIVELGCWAHVRRKFFELQLNQLEPLAYLTDILTRLPTHPNSRIEELLPTHWRPAPQ